MKALTIRHPWPWAICCITESCNPKRIENRTWKPSPTQLPPGVKFAIHAGKMPSVIEIQEAFEGMAAMDAIDEYTNTPTMAELRTMESAIVAVATFGGIVTERDCKSRWFCGPYGWVLKDVIVLPEPVKCRGAQGLWNVPPDVLAKMRAQFNTCERAPTYGGT